MRSRRVFGQLAVLGVLVAASVAGSGVGTAAAATSLDVVVGFGGVYYPGRPMRVRVRIAADRLVRGTLEVRASQGPVQVVVSRPIELPGGSDKEVVVAVPDGGAFVGPGGGVNVEVALREGGDEVASAQGSAQWMTDTEVVGVLPGARQVTELPASTALRIDAGTARFAAVDQLDLDEPGALGALDVLAVEQNEVAGLGEDARDAVLEWLGDGGRLLVLAPAGAEVPGLPDAWQPGASGRARAARGDVVLFTGDKATWFKSLLPTPARSSMEDGAQMVRGFPGVPVSTLIARDAGLKLARVGWLVGFLVAYVVVAGPLAFVVLRRTNRALWFWFVIPAIAAVFTGGAWMVGRSLRSGATSAQTTIVELRSDTARATTWLGTVSRGGGRVTVPLPRGWVGRVSFNQFAFNGQVVPVRVAQTSRGTVSQLDLTAGEFGVTSAQGPVAVEGDLQITATSAEDGRVDGTVRNTTTMTLEDVRAFAGNAFAKVGSLAPGEEKPFTVAGASSSVFGGAPSDVWGQFSMFDGSIDDASPANTGAWAELLTQQGNDWAGGSRATVAGWTKEFPAPIGLGNGRVRGRTAIVGSAVVLPAGDHLTDRSIARTTLRTNLGVGPNAGGRWSAVYAFELPDGAGTDPGPLWLRTASGNTAVSVWSNGAWKELVLTDGGVEPAASLEPPSGPGPGGGAFPMATTVVPFPGGGGSSGSMRVGTIDRSVLLDGQIFVQVTAPADNGPGAWLFDAFLTGTRPA